MLEKLRAASAANSAARRTTANCGERAPTLSARPASGPLSRCTSARSIRVRASSLPFQRRCRLRRLRTSVVRRAFCKNIPGASLRDRNARKAAAPRARGPSCRRIRKLRDERNAVALELARLACGSVETIAVGDDIDRSRYTSLREIVCIAKRRGLDAFSIKALEMETLAQRPRCFDVFAHTLTLCYHWFKPGRSLTC